jgi:SPP1 gp7 family putative phage head morphogenesis protein
VAESVNQQIADAEISHGLNILRVANGMRRTVLEMLTDMGLEIDKQLAKSTSDWERKRLTKVLSMINETIARSYQEISEHNGQDLEKIAKVEFRAQSNIFNEAIGIDVASPRVDEKVVEALAGKTLIEGLPTSKWWERQSEDTQWRYEAELRKGMVAGNSIDEMVRTLRGTKANNYTDGVLHVPKHRAETLVRTSVAGVQNAAKLEMYAEQEELIKELQHLSTLDGRTSEICIARNGLRWTYPEQQPIGHEFPFQNPPIHPNCRSLLSPMLKSWEELAGVELPQIDDRTLDEEFQRQLQEQGFSKEEAAKIKRDTRSSMDGQVPEAQGFQGWLKGKSQAFQDKLLGTQKAELWRAGKISLQDLVDPQTGSVLTIAELEAKIA